MDRSTALRILGLEENHQLEQPAINRAYRVKIAENDRNADTEAFQQIVAARRYLLFSSKPGDASSHRSNSSEEVPHGSIESDINDTSSNLLIDELVVEPLPGMNANIAGIVRKSGVVSRAELSFQATLLDPSDASLAKLDTMLRSASLEERDAVGRQWAREMDEHRWIVQTGYFNDHFLIQVPWNFVILMDYHFGEQTLSQFGAPSESTYGQAIASLKEEEKLVTILNQNFDEWKAIHANNMRSIDHLPPPVFDGPG